MTFPPSVFRRNIPDPGTILVNRGTFDQCDEWQLADRRHILHIFKEYAKGYAKDMALALILVGTVAILLSSMVALVLNEEPNLENSIYLAISIVVVSYLLMLSGMLHIIHKYEQAMEDNFDDY